MLHVLRRGLCTGPSQRTRVLEAASQHVGTYGWSEEALAQGAKAVGLSAAAHGQFSRGPVELVEFVAEKCRTDLAQQIDAEADDLKALESWRPRLKRAIAMRLNLSVPWHEHRAQALGLMTASFAADAAPVQPPAAVPALASLAGDLARATLVEPISEHRWRARNVTAAAAYALAEVRALADTPDLKETQAFADRLVDTLGDAADAPAALKDALTAGAHAAKSLSGAALSFLPPKAVGALPQMFDLLSHRAGDGVKSLLDTILDRILAQLPPSPVPDPPSSKPPADSSSSSSSEPPPPPPPSSASSTVPPSSVAEDSPPPPVASSQPFSATSSVSTSSPLFSSSSSSKPSDAAAPESSPLPSESGKSPSSP